MQTEEYISTLNLENTADSIHRVFTKAIEDYLHGAINAHLFNQVCDKIQDFLNHNDVVIRDTMLLEAIEEGVELEYYRKEATDLARAEDSFKAFYKNSKE